MLNRFQRWAIVTTLATYFLIMVGALVRAAGAGMGCPDWPRCFDRWIPPTDVSQVPAYIDPAKFNVTLAWIEYINRLVGVAIGIFIFITLVLAVRHYRRTPRVLWPTVAAFIGVSFEGWLGSQVVKHELEPWIVTVHLVVALIIVSLLLYATVCAFFPGGRPLEDLPPYRRRLGQATLAVLGVVLVQIGLGAWLRGDIEVVAARAPELARARWLDHVGMIEVLHASLAQLVFLLVLALFVMVRRTFRGNRWLERTSTFCALLVLAQLLSGLGLAGFALPPVLQVLHLLMASLLMGALTTLALLAWRLPVAGSSPSFPGSSPAAADPTSFSGLTTR